MNDKVVWVYFVSRDSVGGVLSDTCHLWHAKPTRVRHATRITWVGTDHKNPGLIGEYPPDEIHKWFRVYPQTDLELIRAEVCPSQKEIDDAIKEQSKR